MENISLGEAIRLLRGKQKMSARKLSAVVGFSPSYINKIEAGEIDPSFKAFAKIAYNLKMSTAEIVYLLNKAANE
jgi:transcriptional regulator with XRE-family HTH domain